MHLASRARYRIWQLWKTVSAKPLPPEAWRVITAVLNPAETELFRLLSGGEQQHAYRVLCTLEAVGEDHPDLLAAALLHDVGKTQIRSKWWDRPIVVLVEALLPGVAEQWARGQASGWKRPFVVKAKHAYWGAEAAERAGSRRFTVDLIRKHHDKPDALASDGVDALLRTLQCADEVN